jgi:hypothetical protein
MMFKSPVIEVPIIVARHGLNQMLICTADTSRTAPPPLSVDASSEGNLYASVSRASARFGVHKHGAKQAVSKCSARHEQGWSAQDIVEKAKKKIRVPSHGIRHRVTDLCSAAKIASVSAGSPCRER